MIHINIALVVNENIYDEILQRNYLQLERYDK